MKIKILFFAVCFTLASCSTHYYKPSNIVSDPTDEICLQFSKQKKNLEGKRMAVAEFTDLNGNHTQEAKLFTERLTTSLAIIEGISIIERTQIEKILKEQDFARSGIVDSETARKLGKILGVDVIVCGTVSKIGGLWEINCRSIDVETGKILTGALVKARSEALYVQSQETGDISHGASPASEPDITPEKKPEIIFVESGSKNQNGREKQKKLLTIADKHERNAVAFKRNGNPRLALREADREKEILRKVIEINPNSPEAAIAKGKIDDLNRAIRRSVGRK